MPGAQVRPGNTAAHVTINPLSEATHAANYLFRRRHTLSAGAEEGGRGGRIAYEE